MDASAVLDEHADADGDLDGTDDFEGDDDTLDDRDSALEADDDSELREDAEDVSDGRDEAEKLGLLDEVKDERTDIVGGGSGVTDGEADSVPTIDQVDESEREFV